MTDHIVGLPPRESLSVEFKSDTTGEAAKRGLADDALVEAVVALYNTEGGTIYLGVEDDGRVSGLIQKHRDPIGLTAMVANRTRPSIQVDASLEQTDHNIEYLQIAIPRGNTVGATTDGRMLRRVFKADGTPQNVPMYYYDLISRATDLGRTDLSAEVIPNATLDDFDPLEIEHLRRIIISSSHADKALIAQDDTGLLQALYLVRSPDSESTRLVPTLAGLLLVGKPDALRKHVPTARCMFQVLAGNEVRMNDEVLLPLLAVFERMQQFFDARNDIDEVDSGLFRLPVHTYDPDAFREALINAFSHRDYTVMRAVRVLLEDKGMTISSPGGFVVGVTVANLLTAAPHSRNTTLADAFKRMGLAEKTGRGVDTIYEGSLRFGRPIPEYGMSTTEDVSVFWPNVSPDENFTRFVFEEERASGQRFDVYDLLVITALREKTIITLEGVDAAMGLAGLRARKTLDSLVERGIVETRSAGDAAGYLLTRRVRQALDNGDGNVESRPFEQAHRQELIISYIRAHGPATRNDVADLLQVSPATAGRLLRVLCDKGEIFLSGKGRGARYNMSA